MSLLFSVSKRIFSPTTVFLTNRIVTRSFVKVGDKIPVNFVKDEPAPVVKEDSEYPEWLFKVGLKEPSLGELLERAESKGVTSEHFTVQEAKRLKRLLTLEEIKASNAVKKASSA